MLDDRKMQVLRAIVTDYVASREPVGSKALVERHQLGVSPATVRNDMAVLEEEGYIAQPHTSAGRIPTDKGYRLFVDKLATIKPLSAAERRAINAFMAGALDVNDLVTRTVRLLAQLTHQVAIVQYPAAQRSTIAHVELVRLAPGRLLVIMVSSTGRVDQQILELPGLGADDVHLASLKLREAALGYTAADAATRIAVALDELDPARRVRINPVFAVALELLGADPVAQVVVAGVPNLAGHSFTTGLRPCWRPSRSRSCCCVSSMRPPVMTSPSASEPRIPLRDSNPPRWWPPGIRLETSVLLPWEWSVPLAWTIPPPSHPYVPSRGT